MRFLFLFAFFLVQVAKADSFIPKNSSEFFNPYRMYYILITGLDSEWHPEWREDHRWNSKKKRKQYRSYPGSRIEIVVLNQDQRNKAFKMHDKCPNTEIFPKEQRVYVANNRQDKTRFSLGLKGNTSIYDWKPNLKIKFAKIKEEPGENRLLGISRINLNAMNRDVSQVREYFATDFFNSMGVPKSQVTYARVCIQRNKENRIYMGLYALIEHKNKGFLKRAFGNQDDGNLYSTNHPARFIFEKEGKRYPDLQKVYELETDRDKESEKASYKDLKILIDAINGKVPVDGENYVTLPPEGKDYLDNLRKVFDVDGFAKWAAVNYTIGAWDNMWKTAANYMLYNKADNTNKPYFVFVPHDYDNIMGARYSESARPHRTSVLNPRQDGDRKNVLLKNLFQNPAFQKIYRREILKFIEATFTRKYVNVKKLEFVKRIWLAAKQEDDNVHNTNPSTGRPFSYTEIERYGWEKEQRAEDRFFHITDREYMKGLRTQALTDFVRERRRHLNRELGLDKNSAWIDR